MVPGLAALALSGLLFACGTLAQSQQPPDTPRAEFNQQTDAAKGQGARNEEQRKSGSRLPVAQPPQGGNTDTRGDGAGETAEYWTIGGFRGRVTDWLIAIFTFCLVAVGAVQGYFLQGTLKATEMAASAAKVAADALPDLERPWLFIESASITRREPPNVANAWYVQFKWKNIGRMPAIVEECICKMIDKDTLPPAPDYANAIQLNYRPTVAAGIEFDTNKIGPGEPGRTKNGAAVQFVVIGRICYRELNGKRHKTGFIWEVAPNIPTGMPITNPAYEYYD